MYIKSNTFSGEGFILAQADNYDTLSVKLTKKDALAGAANADGKFIVKQGTIYKNAGGRAIGIVFNSVDVTDGSSNVAIIIKGTVLIGKLPAIPTEAEAKQAQKYLNLEDRCKCIENICLYSIKDTTELKSYINRLFTDEKVENAVMLSTAHKSKGLEANRVLILLPNKLPLTWQNQLDWQLKQELNLKYVALTRARKELVFIDLDEQSLLKATIAKC